MHECSKAVMRRLADSRFASRYFVGDGIDIGAGPDPLGQYAELFPRMGAVRAWDQQDGDAELLDSVPDQTYQFVHSSHCLEHLKDPRAGIWNWFRVLRPGGHLVCVVPDEDLYEQGVFPSQFNPDHKWTFTIFKPSSWSARSVNILDLVQTLPNEAHTIKIELLDATFRYSLPRFDQTLTPVGECAIEFIVRRRTPDEMVRHGVGG